MTSVIYNLHACIRSADQGLPELRLYVIVWEDSVDSVHLYDKRDLAMISIFRRDGQLFLMFHAALCRGIRKKTDPPYRIRCQCTSLYFRQVFLSRSSI